jgi:threonine synthase
MEEMIANLRPAIAGEEITAVQQCTNCGARYGLDLMIGACPSCKGRIEYVFGGEYRGRIFSERDSLWRNADLIPLKDPRNIFSLGEGASPIVEFEELSTYLNGARLFMMMDSEKNPTGIFKDREASIVMSRCKELGLDNLVFYSTGNTGRSYTHYAAHLGFTSYFFMPKQCHYKNTKYIKKNTSNYIIYVDDNYPKIAPFAKRFAEENGLTAIAPLQDRNEAYATVAYEQFQNLPQCDYFVQTIASGMGPIGFLRGHRNLVKFGLQKKENIPRVICIQSSEMNVMSVAYNSGKTSLLQEDLPATFESNLYEPTLNSTNPVNNYRDLFNCLKETNGLITHVDPEEAECLSGVILESFKKRGMMLRPDLEKSVLIEFAGLVQLAQKGHFTKGEVILLLSCGRGKDNTTELYSPDAVIDPVTCNGIELKKRLEGLL